MIRCDDAQLSTWSPKLDGVGPATWTKLLLSKVEVCNSLEWVDWHPNPVQVELCECCGMPGCSFGGYVNISRIGKHLLWSRRASLSLTQEEDVIGESVVPYYIRRHGAVCILAERWNEWAGSHTRLPSAETFPATTRLDLASAWITILDPDGSLHDTALLIARLREKYVACDCDELGDPLWSIERMLEWVDSDPGATVEGSLLSPNETGARIATIYFDEFRVTEWPALGIGQRITIALEKDVVFWPPPVLPEM